MIKSVIDILKKYSVWLIAIILLNVIFGFLLWIVNGKAFRYIFPTMIFGSTLLYITVGFIVYKRDLKRKEAINSFLKDPSLDFEREIIEVFHKSEGEIIKEIGKTLRQYETTIKKQSKGIEEYEEYIEAWAHEIKTPLALMTFILDNRRDEIPSSIYNRLEYARTKMQEDIERMLYYARLKSSRDDYFFRELPLKSICMEVLEEYEILLKEQGVETKLDIEDIKVVSDKKGLQFIIKQVISNTIKYRKVDINSPQVYISCVEDDESISLVIRDNGIGIKEYDLPFIFDKGFTGEIGEQRKNSTGMGLYLAKQVADNLNITLNASMEYKEGFEISLMFPKVEN